MGKNFSPKYLNYIHSEEWREKSKRFRRATGDRCVLFPFLRSNHAHHLTYKNLESEQFVRDCVGLNAWSHDLVHFLYKCRIKVVLDLYLRCSATVLWL